MPVRKTFLFLSGDRVVFLLTVLVALAPALAGARFGIGTSIWWAFCACGVAYLALGFLDHSTVAGRQAWRLGGYFALQTLLLGGIFALTQLRGMVVLAAFPLVGQAVSCLRPSTAAVFVSLLYAGIMGGAALAERRQDLLSSGASILVGFAFVVVFTRIAMREKTARSEAERLAMELAKAIEQLRAQAAFVEELAKTRERNRVAREIHDSVGHGLTAIAIQLEASEAMHTTDPDRSQGAVKKARVLAAEALAEVRRSVGTLRSEARPRPLADRLRELTACDGRCEVNFVIAGNPRSLPPETEHSLFRAAQEGLTNVRRHAGAKFATLTLDYDGTMRVSVTLVDNGQGSMTSREGYGLTGLRERVALLGGTLTVANRPEGGFELRMEVPG